MAAGVVSEVGRARCAKPRRARLRTLPSSESPPCFSHLLPVWQPCIARILGPSYIHTRLATALPCASGLTHALAHSPVNGPRTAAYPRHSRCAAAIDPRLCPRVVPPSALAPPSTSHHALGASASFIPDTAHLTGLCFPAARAGGHAPKAAGGGACGGTREAGLLVDCQWGMGPGCWWGVRVASGAGPAYTPGCCHLLSLCCIWLVGLL